MNFCLEIFKMIRRAPTSIELKLDDLGEYEAYRNEQELAKEQAKGAKPTQEPPAWNPGPKGKLEIYERIGYVPPTNTNTCSPIY